MIFLIRAIALITGGAGGIGKQTAIEFAKLGIDLYLMDYNGTMLDKTVKEIKTAYPRIQVKSKGRVKLQSNNISKTKCEIHLYRS